MSLAYQRQSGQVPENQAVQRPRLVRTDTDAYYKQQQQQQPTSASSAPMPSQPPLTTAPMHHPESDSDAARALPRKSSRQGSSSMRIDTSLETIQHGSSATSRSRPRRQHEREHRLLMTWQPDVSIVVTSVTDQAVDVCHTKHYNTEENDVAEEKERHREAGYRAQDSRMGSETIVRDLAVTDDPRNESTAPSDIAANVALCPPLARSMTVISVTSSTGRPRLTHRLSYLAHLQDDEAEEEERIAVLNSVPSTPNPYEHEAQIEKVPRATSSLSRLPPPPPPPTSSSQKQPPFSTVSATARGRPAQLAAVRLSPLAKSSPQISNGAPPQIPKLYKRLLRVFKPPTESSDSDPGEPTTDTSATIALAKRNPQRGQAKIQARGPFGLPTSPESSARGASYTPRASKQKPVERAAVEVPVYNYATASAPSSISKTASPVHRPPESTGFRARFLKKLLSSPNLNTVVYPMKSAPPSTRISAVPSVSVRPADAAKAQQRLDQQAHCNQCYEAHAEEEPISSYSPLASDFEHEGSCPAGQRIQEKKNGSASSQSAGSGRPRATTLPKVQPGRMPTLQSKYGVPGRELGAGTQAQVMLLRVKSSKRLKNTSMLLDKNCELSVPPKHQQQQHESVPARGLLSPIKDEGPVDSLLPPRPRSGTLMTTTEDEVTPEQREAYRKRLLRRTSTAGLSISGNGGGLIYAIKKFRPPKATETHRQYLKKVCAEFCISTSMEHENIIRTIDLVRDQPGQELWDDEAVEQFHPVTRALNEEGPKDDYRDCSCPREHSRRVRAIKSADELRSQCHNHGAPPSPTSSRHHRPIPRRSVISKPQRKRSMDSLSNRRSLVGTPEPISPRVQEQNEYRHYRHHQHHGHIHQQSNLSEAQMIVASKKMKQQQDQELRQKEVLRLKQQKQREKQQAKQLRLNLFPEYCMVMEFAAGGDLFNLLTKSYPPISLHEKHCLWRQLVNGVQYMHSMGVAHRDLKPENILIDATGKILKITDFGIANVFKSVGDPNPLPCSGIIGSEPYIAPEEFYQEEYDPRAVDVWACGIIFYVMYYSAMPWARADRKKDARFSRYISDIMTHRHGEAQRKMQFERRQLINNSSGSAHGLSFRGPGSLASSDAFNRPHEVIHQRQFPPYEPAEYATGSQSNNINSPSPGASSSHTGSPLTPQSNEDTESPNSSVSASPVSPNKSCSLDEAASAASSSATTNAVAVVPPVVYNTFLYNGHIGGHEFLDRIETLGCRRIMYAILEPDARKRVTIDQVLKDEWVSRIRYCTDCPIKQEQQATMAFGGRGNYTPVNASRYMQLTNGELHHHHATPKKVKH